MVKYKVKITVVLIVALCSLIPFLVQGEQAPMNSCVTAKCHANLLKTKNIHPVAEPCDTCHQAVSTPHPEIQETEKKQTKGKKKGKEPENKNVGKNFKLTESVPKLCYQCHSAFGTMKSFHSPVKDGLCTTCHDPHDSAQPKLLTQPVKNLCLSCHPDKTGYKFGHSPTAEGDCTSCHSPHQSANASLLVKDAAELCFQCHPDMQDKVKKKVVHPALGMGCPSCHNPHGSASKKFLSAEGNKVCYACHAGIESKVTGTVNRVHAPIKSERGCSSCHSPHASDQPKLLLKAGKELCLDCHKDMIKKTQKVLHGPIKDSCTPCHDPHGTPNDKLLIKPYSSEFYVSYNDNEFPLCFNCHNRELLRFPKTSYATGFRDGENNLHYLHVNRKERGRRCKACHVVHAGENPKLIADKVPFGNWNLPIQFVKTENGGGCSPGCHKPYAYDRKNPAKGAPPTADKQKSKKKKK